jgi:hypothetical protein
MSNPHETARRKALELLNLLADLGGRPALPHAFNQRVRSERTKEQLKRSGAIRAFEPVRLQPFWDVSRSIFAAALMLALVSCQTTDKGPVGVVQAYCEAAYRGDCETWWSLLTANSRSAIEADVEYDKTGQKCELSAQKKWFAIFFTVLV